MEKKNKLLTVIIPCYNEEEALPYFYDEINRVSNILNETDFEFLFIDDGSSDRTLQVLQELALKDERVRYVSFSRNFGKEAAMYAGLENAKGDYIAIMDADLQDPPSLLPEMLSAIENEGYDGVCTKRKTRKGEPVIRSFFAEMFYKIINKISKVNMVSGARDYFLIKRKMRDSILKMSEYNRYTKGIFNWVGFNVKWIAYDNIERVAGQTKWSFWKLFKYSKECIISFSTAPLAIASFAGFFFCLISLIGIIFIIIRDLIGIQSAAGWPSMICIILFVGGMQLFCIGILGQYLARTYLETKNRPLYLVAETEEEYKNKRQDLL
ncbi:glycosyltransferase family 2 protein [Eubacteriales bacterium OttesenSCG-928-G02]|nr:glycosyltransferase family 2 protein [Eubacteriales bacterium OttesenSCG-928-G02]